MVFISAVAGPSRLPWRAVVTPLASTCRRCASTDVTAASEEPDVAVELDDKDSRHARIKEKAFYGTRGGYQSWVKTGGASQFYAANKGQRAQWLDPNMPYPTNPSFRPPPPISNDLQDTIYRQLKRSAKTVGQLAEQYNISKARIEAIRKLKQVEDEFKRQAIPLQQAFHNSMEPLLGVEPPVRSEGKKQSVIDAEAAQYREEIPGTAIEREEEERLDAGIGEGGAFGNMVKQKRAEGIERTAWEFRSEELVMMEKQAEAKAAAGAETEAEKLVAEQEAAPSTPDQVHHKDAPVVDKVKQLPSRTVRPNKTKYRFVDTSKA